MDKKIPYDQFEEYLNGTLKDVELKDFEQQLKSDNNFKKELNLYQEIKKAQQNNELTDFEAKLKSTELWRLTAAAVFIGFLMIAGLKYFQSPPTTDQLYARFAKHEFSFQEMSSNTTLGEIQILLDKQQYSNALPLINAYVVQNTNAADVKLARAITLLETQKYGNALTAFKSLRNQHPLYQNESLWYQALTYLKQNQVSNSLNFLHQISNDSSRYVEAQELISFLE